MARPKPAPVLLWARCVACGILADAMRLKQKALGRRSCLVSRVLPVTLIAVAAATPASAQIISLDPPGEGEFILDRAALITEEDKTAIRQLCDKLLTDRAIPIVVVTIPSMADYGGTNLRIETFATLLFNQWGIGSGHREWNTGILLLVSTGDRKVRIELGATWSRDHDQACQEIMDDQIISRFKRGRFSEGIRAGVVALDKMARGLPLPGKPIAPSQVLTIAGVIVLAVFTVVSLFRSGTSGWGWLLWAAIFGILGTILFTMLTSRRGAYGYGGGFSGGSFGGGFSGGGGATGSW